METKTHLCLDDTAEAALADGEEDVRPARSTACVDGDADGAVGRVLEASGHGEGGGQLTVDLRLGGAGTDGTPGDEVGGVLRRDGIEELAASGEADAWA